jgi:hypothetical protein
MSVWAKESIVALWLRGLQGHDNACEEALEHLTLLLLSNFVALSS